MDELAIDVSEQKLAQFCHRWHIQELAFFGSVLRDDFGSSSDVDVLVTYDEAAAWGLLEHVQMEHELERLFGHGVDLVSKRAVKQNHNWMRRRAILDSAQVVFSSREKAYGS